MQAEIDGMYTSLTEAKNFKTEKERMQDEIGKLKEEVKK